MNVQKEFEKSFRGSHKLLQAHEKVCDENERKKETKKKEKKQLLCKNFCGARKDFIRLFQKNG